MKKGLCRYYCNLENVWKLLQEAGALLFPKLIEARGKKFSKGLLVELSCQFSKGQQGLKEEDCFKL